MGRRKDHDLEGKWLPDDQRDWIGVRADYEVGQMTLTDLQNKYRIQRDTIRYRAKVENWERGKHGDDVAARIRELKIEEEVKSSQSRATRELNGKTDETRGGLDRRDPASRARGSELPLVPDGTGGYRLPAAELAQAASVMQALGLTPSGQAVSLLSDEEREKIAIELAARRHIEVTRSQKKVLGRMVAMIDRMMTRLERYADGDETAMVLGERETVGSMLRDLATATAKLIPLERQVHGIDQAMDQVTVFVPTVGRRAAPVIDAETGRPMEMPDEPLELQRIDITRRRQAPQDDDEE